MSFLEDIFELIREDFGKEIIKNTIKLSGDQVGKLWKNFSYRKAAKNYTEKLERIYGEIQILGMSKPESVRNIFTYLNFFNSPSYLKFSNLELIEYFFMNKTIFNDYIECDIDGLDAVLKHKKIVVLGKPGSGKTTFLKSLISKTIDGEIQSIPVFVEIREYVQEDVSIFEYICNQMKICKFPNPKPYLEKVLSSGKAIVMFDGIDEAKKEGKLRNKTIKAIDAFTKEWENSKFIITCRIAATKFIFRGFTYFEIADFNKDQINIFISKWFDNKKIEKSFINEFYKRKELQEIASCPLFLALLCISYRNITCFPRKKSDIFKVAILAILATIDSERLIERDQIIFGISPEDKLKMLSEISAHFFFIENFIFKKKDIKDCIEIIVKRMPNYNTKTKSIERVFNEIIEQHGIFVERSTDIFSFSHLTLQEFLTALYVSQYSEDKLVREMVNNYLFDEKWREVFIMYSELTHNNSLFFQISFKVLSNHVINNSNLRKLLIRIDEESKRVNTDKSPSIIKATIFQLFLENLLYLNFPFPKGIPDIISFTDEERYIYDVFESKTKSIDVDFAYRLTIHMKRLSDLFGNVISHSDIQLSTKLSIENNFLSSLLNAGYYPKVCIENFNIGLKSLSKMKNFNKFKKSIKKLKIPSQNTTMENVDKFRNKLKGFIDENFSIDFYNIYLEDFESISNYLYATELLKICFDSSNIDNREKIENIFFSIE